MAEPLKLKLGRGTIEVPWSRLDRAIESVAPQWAARRLQARVGHALTAHMGGWNGASTSRRSLAGWVPQPSDADSDTLVSLPMLRGRSSDLVRNAPVAGGAINTTVTKVVGTGLSLQATPDATALRLTADEADAWARDVETKFAAWWETTDCDITRTQTGHALTDLVLRSECERGDVFAVLANAKWSRGPVKLAVQLVEADRCCNPDRKPDTDRMVAGIELDDAGAPVRYHFASANPYTRSGTLRGGARITWSSVAAFGQRTGRRNVLHVFQRRRVGQTRGVPMLAPVIEPLKQLERYTEAELMAAVVSGMFTVFIQAEGPSTVMPSALTGANQAPAGGNSGADKWDGKLGNGLVVELGKNESINTANPGRPNSQFDPFVQAIIRQIGLLLEIPFEVLVKHYSSSYSAARAALLDAWSYFRVRRDRLATQFCQPVFEAWMDEAVAVGYVRAPGYFADPLVRRAWLLAEWTGDGPGAIDPLKEVQSADARVRLGISTREAESLAHDGRRLGPKLRQLAREEAAMAGLQMSGPAAGGMPGGAPGQQPGDDNPGDGSNNDGGNGQP